MGEIWGVFMSSSVKNDHNISRAYCNKIWYARLIFQKTNNDSQYIVNSLTPGKCSCNLKLIVFKHISRRNYSPINTKRPHWWLVLMASSNWLSTIRQQAITWTNVGPVLWYHKASLGQKLMPKNQGYVCGIGRCSMNMCSSWSQMEYICKTFKNPPLTWYNTFLYFQIKWFPMLIKSCFPINVQNLDSCSQLTRILLYL